MILLDRDGTLIEERGYLKDPAGVRLIPGVLVALKRLKAAGRRLVVVSNQSGLGRGLISRGQARRVRQRFEELLRKGGIVLDGHYVCPHSPQDRCACRKPKLALVKKAARDLGTGWQGSISVGDRPSDVWLGQRTGGRGVLVLTGYGKKWNKGGPARPDRIAKSIATAVPWILRQIGKDASKWSKKRT